ncbi:hypothetical protein ACFE04_026145 [Oxalis oulophora]
MNEAPGSSLPHRNSDISIIAKRLVAASARRHRLITIKIKQYERNKLHKNNMEKIIILKKTKLKCARLQRKITLIRKRHSTHQETMIKKIILILTSYNEEYGGPSPFARFIPYCKRNANPDATCLAQYNHIPTKKRRLSDDHHPNVENQPVSSTSMQLYHY